MNELTLTRKIFWSFRQLGISRKRLAFAYTLMVGASLLEMGGISALYPLVLALGKGGEKLNSLPWPHQLVLLSVAGKITALFALLCLIFTLKNLALYFSYDFNIRIATRYYENLVLRLYQAFISKPLLEFKKESSGSMAHYICVQSERLVDGALRPFFVMSSEAIILTSILCLVFWLSPALGLTIVLFSGGAGSIYFLAFRRSTIRWGKTHMESSTALQELVHDSVKGISEIKVFQREKYLGSRIRTSAISKMQMFHHLEMHQQGPRYLAETSFIIAVSGFFVFFIWRDADPAKILAQLSVVAAASFRILPCVNRIVGSYSNFSFNIEPASMLLNVLKENPLPPEAASSDSTSPTPNLAVKEIALRGIAFAYAGSQQNTFEKVELRFLKGHKVGIAGESGSGKSTLLNIVAGLISPSHGMVEVDGLEISQLGHRWRNALAYVPQEAFILPATIRENVVFGDINRSDDDRTLEILKRVGLGEFVSKLPNGLNTKIGEKGLNLSGGQKQLLCLARALFREPQVLLLDEPTASLDAQSEEVVLKAINSLEGHQTVIMVSHKLQNFRSFNEVYRFDPRIRTFRLETTEVSSPNSGESRDIRGTDK